jgi:integrase
VQPEEHDYDDEPTEAFPGINEAGQRRNFVTRVRLFEHRGVADGIVYQEVVRGLLERGAWRSVRWTLFSLLGTIGIELKTDSPEYEAAAEELLRRLANHEFSDWQEGVRQAIAPVAELSECTQPEAISAPTTSVATRAPSAPWVNAGARSEPHQTLSEGLTRWKKAKAPGTSAMTETTRAVERFIELYGDRHVASITVNDIFDYREFLSNMPKGINLPAVKASGRSLRQAVEEAKEAEVSAELKAVAEERPAPARKRLSPTSIKKDIGGLSAIFAVLRSERWILNNPADNIPVDGYSKGKKVFPFRPDMMKRLFDSPMFTGCAGRAPSKRALSGPHVYQDTLYWSFLFGATVGHRMSEVAAALTENVEETTSPTGERIVGIFIMDAKNEYSQRVIIVHPHLLSLGFLDYVRERRRLGLEQLFDLPGGGAKKLSERLNDYIDDVLIDDRRYVFHSLRHEFADRSEVDVGVDLSKKIMDHARERLYGLGAPLHHAAAELNKVDLSFVDWDRLRAAASRPVAAAA